MFLKDAFLILIFLNHYSYGLHRQSNIVFQNNGYSNVVIAISDNVPEDQGLIDKIKTAMTATSKQLYSSTKKQAYFKEIYILVPHTWTNNPSYGTATTQTLRMADIVVSKPIQRNQRHVMTRSYSGCGKSGIHIQLLTDFFTNTANPPDCSGNMPCYSKDELIARHLVHDWANFRWGVYNEYPTEGESQFYFSTLSGRPEAVRCSTGLRGQIFQLFPNGTANVRARCLRADPATGMYPDGCKYFPNPFRNLAKASIMDRDWINEIVQFCDDDKTPRSQTAHNVEPPNKHNRLCSHRSTWDVISNTSDFKAGINPPRDISPSDLVPQFHIVKASATKRIAIVLDYPPGTTERKIKKRDIHQAIGAFMHKIIDDGSEVVVLHNSKQPRVLHPLTRIRSEQDRQSIMKRVLTSSNEKESKLNLMETLKILYEDGNRHEKHVVFIGCGNASSQASDNNIKAFQNVGVQFHSLVCDESSHLFNRDRLKTLGQLHFVSRNQEHNSLLDGLHEISKVTRQPLRRSIKLFSKNGILVGGLKDFTGHFSVDTVFKHGIGIMITYQHKMPTLRLKSPAGTPYTGYSVHHDANLKLILVHIDDIMLGEWLFTIKSNAPVDDIVSVIVSAETDTSNPTIELSAHVETINDFALPAFAIFARINKGHNPIVDVNVSAVVESPSGKLEVLKLLDNGAGADTERQDGIYSRYFTRVKEAGNYNIRIEARHDTDLNAFTELIYNEQLHDSNHLYQRVSTSGLSRVISGSVYIAENDFPRASALNLQENHPPSRIKDLKVESISQINRALTLTWTAPGDDLDQGSASSYDIRYDSSGITLLQLRDNARKLPDEFIIHNKGPREAGERELIKLKMQVLQNQTASFAFIIRAIDKDGNCGEFSNLATVGIDRIPYVVVNTEKARIVEQPVVLLIAIVIVLLIIVIMIIMVKASIRRDEKIFKKHCPV